MFEVVADAGHQRQLGRVPASTKSHIRQVVQPSIFEGPPNSESQVDVVALVLEVALILRRTPPGSFDRLLHSSGQPRLPLQSLLQGDDSEQNGVEGSVGPTERHSGLND